MNLEAYIASGVLQDYCLGMLPIDEVQQVESFANIHPEIRQEIDGYYHALEMYALACSKELPDNSKAKIFSNIDNLIQEEKADAANLPFLNKFSDYTNWLKTVKPLLPEILGDELFVHVLRDDEEVLQMILWSRVDYPDEVHVNEQESFLVLEGECDCYIGDDVISLSAGGFYEIPLHLHHDVKITKGPVLAVVQHLKKVA